MNIELAIADILASDPNTLEYPSSLGSRYQSGTLPAYTYEISNMERADLKGQWVCDLEIRCIDFSLGNAMALYSYLPAAIVPGTYPLLGGTTITSAIHQGRTVEPPTVGEGDEREPAEVVARWSIIFTE